MLSSHAPLVVAEQFGTLEALYPGRIDLGSAVFPVATSPRCEHCDGICSKAERIFRRCFKNRGIDTTSGYEQPRRESLVHLWAGS